MQPSAQVIFCAFIGYVFVYGPISVAPAGPEGAQVVHGQVSFEQSGLNTVITASDKSIVNYSSFNIARPETVEFVQPGSNASVLNRILSANPTHIDGTLSANGRVFFVNPAGVYIGSEARINVSQLVASGLNISDSDFLNEQYHFAGGNGSVVNHGDISAEKVHLIGKHVVNSGTINCPDGCMVMAVGDRVFLGEPGSDLTVEVEADAVQPPEPTESPDLDLGIRNEGTIDAAGGKIVLAAAGDVYSQAISNVGKLSASVQAGSAGEVKLVAECGTVSNDGTIAATSDSGAGGTVVAEGDEIVNSATVNVTGAEGGQVMMEATTRLGQFGAVRADGSDSHGGDVELTAGDVVALSSDSLTTVNAGTNGDGGEVVVYSPDTALFHDGATIEAKGGNESGDGGFVEVSGKEHVEVFGLADVSADNGDAGTFFIDPHNVTIQDGAGTLDSGGNPFAAGSDGDTVSDDTIEGVINAGGAAVVQTSDGGLGDGDIIQDADATIDFSGAGGDASLTLNAADDVELNGGIATRGATAKLNITINANGNYDTASGEGDVDINADIATNGGKFTSSGIDFDNASGVISTSSGNVDIQNTGDVIIGAEINAGDGDLSIDGGDSIASNIISSGGILKSSGTTTLKASGNIGEYGERIETASTGTINVSSTVDGDVCLKSTSNNSTTLGSLAANDGDIFVISKKDLILSEPVTTGDSIELVSTQGNIETQEIHAINGTISIKSRENLTLKGSATSGDIISLQGGSNVETKELDASGLYIAAWAGLYRTGNLILNGPVSAKAGGVELTTYTGKIYTLGWDAINVAINGYSDSEKGEGIPLNFPHSLATAAIVIKSKEDLTLGPDAKLIAKGIYQTGVDDSRDVNVQSVIGDPIDVAIYARSESGDVTVESAVSIDSDGTMVIDAWNKVDDFVGPKFKDSWTKNASTNRLELVSRTTQTLEQAASLGTLPHAQEARQGVAPDWFGGSAYVLRGGSDGHVFADIERESPPLMIQITPPLPDSEPPPESDHVELMLWLEEEGIAPYFEGANPEMLTTDLRFVKAAKQLRDYAKTLRDTKSDQIDILARILAEHLQEPMDIAQVNGHHVKVWRRDDEVHSLLRGEWTSALIGYVQTLNAEFGYPSRLSIDFVMAKYVETKLTDIEAQDLTEDLLYYVQMSSNGLPSGLSVYWTEDST
jgi:filamentous hemagglutinin family protein